MTNDFAWLPMEIVCDIIETATYPAETALKTLALFEGSWAESANRATANWQFRYSKVGKSTDLIELKANASQLYEHLVVLDIPESFHDLLELMGTRFSRIQWYNWVDSDLAFLQFANFLKRQLQSTHLRRIFTGMGIEQLDNKHFVDFVKTSHFEELRLDTLDLLPFELFEGAHQAWEMTERFQVRRKRIHSRISAETKDKIEKYFDTELIEGKFNEISLTHPVHSRAKMNMNVFTSDDDWNVEMEFVDLQDEDESEQDGANFSDEENDDDDDNMSSDENSSRSDRMSYSGSGSESE